MTLALRAREPYLVATTLLQTQPRLSQPNTRSGLHQPRL